MNIWTINIKIPRFVIIWITLLLNTAFAGLDVYVADNKVEFELICFQNSTVPEKGDVISIPGLSMNIVHDGRERYDLEPFDEYGRIYEKTKSGNKLIYWDLAILPESEQGRIANSNVTSLLRDIMLPTMVRETNGKVNENMPYFKALRVYTDLLCKRKINKRRYLKDLNTLFFKPVTKDILLAEDLSSLKGIKYTGVSRLPEDFFQELDIANVFCSFYINDYKDHLSSWQELDRRIRYLKVETGYRGANKLKKLRQLKFLNIRNNHSGKVAKSYKKNFEFIFNNSDLNYLFAERIPVNPGKLFRLSSLKSLNLVREIGSLKLTNLVNLSSLEELNLHDCRILDLRAISEIPNLKKCSLLGSSVRTSLLYRTLNDIKKEVSHIEFDQNCKDIFYQSLAGTDRVELHVDRRKVVKRADFNQLKRDQELRKSSKEAGESFVLSDKEKLKKSLDLLNELIKSEKTVRIKKKLLEITGKKAVNFCKQLKFILHSEHEVRDSHLYSNYSLKFYKKDKIIKTLDLFEDGVVKWDKSAWGITDYASIRLNSYQFIIDNLRSNGFKEEADRFGDKYMTRFILD